MSANWTEKEWRDHIENRRRNSAGWQLVHILGSLRLAMLLLFSILIACAIATFAESKFTAQVAQIYIYKAPWFIVWLGVLCINLFCVTLTRWPWRRKHFGFVITHYGIIILLIGAAWGQKGGFEANVTLREGEGQTRDLVLNRTVLQIQGGRDMGAYKVPLEVAVRPPTPERPKSIRLLDSPLRLRVEAYSSLEERPEVVASPLMKQGSGVALEFRSAMMTQSLPVRLVQNPGEMSRSDFFGRAQIELLDALPDRTGAKPPEKVLRETQVVFAKGSESIITPLRGGEATGYRFGLQIPADGEPQVVIELAGLPTPGGRQTRRETFPLSAVLGKSVTLSGETTELLVRDYWPDMEMREGRPVTKSQEPNNPAILVLLSGEVGESKPLLELAVSQEDGQNVLRYQMSRSGVITASGQAVMGESFQLGWADWKATVQAAFPSATLTQNLTPIPGDPAKNEEAVPGVLARLVSPSGEAGEAQWIPSGRGMTLRLGQETAFVGFGLEVYKLPFTLELLKFEVPRYRGSTKPSDFRSTVRFLDDRTQESAEALIRMNHPAGFPQGFWLTALGKNYKFSQAKWNSQDLKETTLQVLHDPGWPLKWIGSLLICIGIGIMFYAPKPSQKLRRKQTAPQTEKASA